VMNADEGTIDRVVRAVLGVVLLYVGLFVLGGATLGVALDVLGLLAVFTGATGLCPLYRTSCATE